MFYAVWSHCLDNLIWYHGPRRGSSEEGGRKGAGSLLVTEVQIKAVAPVVNKSRAAISEAPWHYCHLL